MVGIGRTIRRAGKKGKIVGLNVVELAPKNDLNQISMIAVGRLILKLLMLQLSSSGPSS